MLTRAAKLKCISSLLRDCKKKERKSERKVFSKDAQSIAPRYWASVALNYFCILFLQLFNVLTTVSYRYTVTGKCECEANISLLNKHQLYSISIENQELKRCKILCINLTSKYL